MKIGDYFRRPVGDPSAASCTSCGARRVHVVRGAQALAAACRECDLLALWPSVQRAAGAT